jgi:hypothetical protein
MRNYGFLFCFMGLILAAAITLACGSAASQAQIAQSLSISPLTADAQDYPNGQVQYTAMATYKNQPGQVKVQPTWGACFQSNATNAVTVSSTGVAQCTAGASGIYTVWGYVMSGDQVCPASINACGSGGCRVTGTAALSCP